MMIGIGTPNIHNSMDRMMSPDYASFDAMSVNRSDTHDVDRLFHVRRRVKESLAGFSFTFQ